MTEISTIFLFIFNRRFSPRKKLLPSYPQISRKIALSKEIFPPGVSQRKKRAQ